MSDAYTRAVLTVIAAALALIAANQWLMPFAMATDTMNCRIEGPIEIRSFNDDLEVRVNNMSDIDVEIDWDSTAPGTSSSYPLHIQSH